MEADHAGGKWSADHEEVESTERKGRRGEAEILEAAEFFGRTPDGSLVGSSGSIRIAANNLTSRAE